MTEPLKVYLAGGFYSGWQDRAKKSAPQHIYYDPRHHGCTSEAEYTAWDIARIQESDVVFAYLESTNPGGHNLAFEVGLADGLGIPFVLVQENERFDRYIGMLRQQASWYFTDFHDALEWWSRPGTWVEQFFQEPLCPTVE